MILCLEGGYNVTSISYAMTMCTKALLGDPITHHYDPKPTCNWSAVESINNTIKVHKKYWKNLKFQIALPVENVLEKPASSRGLIVSEDYDAEKSDISQSSSLNDTNKSIHNASKSLTELNGSIETHMANLSINKPVCSDVIHCGTDDEDDQNVSKSKSTGCPKSSEEKANEAGSSKSECQQKNKIEAGSSKKDFEKGVQNHSLAAGSSKTDSEKGGQNQTLVDFLSENMQAIVNEEMFAVIPLPWCPQLGNLFAIPSDVKFEQGVKCVDCDHTVENWVCLHCFIVSIFF